MKELILNKGKASGFNKRKLFYAEQLLRFLPNDYLDTNIINDVRTENIEKDITVIAKLHDVSMKTGAKMQFIRANLTDVNNNQVFSVVWFNQPYLINELKTLLNKDILINGKLEWNENYKSFSFSNPYIFTDNILQNLKVFPVYPEVAGSSNKFVHNLILEYLPIAEETLPDHLLQQYSLPTINDAMIRVHNPYRREWVTDGLKRFVFDELMYFAMEMNIARNNFNEESFIKISNEDLVKKAINSLPFELTNDQANTFESIKTQMLESKTVNALIQGDVGCGKTILAFLFMFLMAENGYQSVLMAPISSLTKQHYNDIMEDFSFLGLPVGYLDSDTKKKERTEILKKLKSGELKCLIGTHSVLSDAVEFENLGLIIIDEEHKFGVEQRDRLRERAAMGTHFISMSATPIPRTTASIIYGKNVTIYNILSMPKNRIPIKTIHDNLGYLNLVESEVQKGRQCYVVCPAIENNDKTEGLLSIEKAFPLYQNRLSPKGISVGCITGKTKAAEKAEIFKAFYSGELKVLISTTVIEVGVNNPNASVIVIHNAERFGLSTLHQLRGRVGRGKYESFCVLVSEQLENERLKAMCMYSSGFDISNIDFELRGPGNILGNRQSGLNKYIELVRSYPNMYQVAEQLAEVLIIKSEHLKHLKLFRDLNAAEEQEKKKSA